MSHKKGYTLIEVLIAGLLAALLGVGVISLLMWMFGASKVEQNRSHLQSEANIFLEELARKVHMGSQVETPTPQFLRIHTGGAPSDSFAISGNTVIYNGTTFMVSGIPMVIVGDSSTFVADTSGNFVNTTLLLQRGEANFKLHTGILRCRN